MELTINNEFKNLIPPLTEQELYQLEQSILKEGCRDSLITWEGAIIDGHNRYEICTKHNIPFKTTEKEFNAKEEAKEWIIKNQFGRRNINSYQKSELALELEELIKARAKENLKLSEGRGKKGCQNSDKVKPIDTKKELAKIAGVSHDTIYKVKTIKEKAPESLKELVRSGETSINQAYEGLRAIECAQQNKRPKQQQTEQRTEQKTTLTPEQTENLRQYNTQQDYEHKIFCRYVDALTVISNLSMDDEKLEIFREKLLEHDGDYYEAQLKKINWGMQNLQKIKVTLTRGTVRNNNLKVVK